MKRTLWILGSIAALILISAAVYSVLNYKKWTQSMPVTGNSNAFVSTPYPAGQVITSPVEVKGAVRASLIGKEGVRATVVNWDGLIIGETQLTPVEGNEGSSGEFVWYKGTVSFTPTECGKDQDFCHRGWIIFGKQYELLVSFK